MKAGTVLRKPAVKKGPVVMMTSTHTMESTNPVPQPLKPATWLVEAVSKSVMQVVPKKNQSQLPLSARRE
jgi:hypothetical protein